MEKMKSFILFYLLFFWGLCAQGQEQAKQSLYFRLDKEIIDYKKSVYSRTAYIETEREYTGYGFLIRCDCHIAGSLSFSGHDNPEVGEIFDPIKVISDSAYKRLKFISFDELLKLLKQHNLRFNDKYNLYFVEPRGKREYTVYNVKFRNSFIPEG